jgi:hypothetical protein
MTGLGFKVNRSGCRAQRSEMTEMGLVEHRDYSVTDAGSRCRTWGLTPRGMALFVKLEDAVFDEARKRGAGDVGE